MIIVRYGEISLKKGKRKEFEKKLVKNIKSALKRAGFESKIEILRGRILIDTLDDAKTIIAHQPGVVSVSPAREMSYEEIFEYLKEKLKDKNPESFKIETQRVDKNFPKVSPEINSEVGEFIVKNFGWKVNLNNPDFKIEIEIIQNRAYVFFEKIKGIGGLPVGTQGKVIALISGGIDSPVAAFLMMKRGAKLIALHFQQSAKQRKVVEGMVNVLNRYSPENIELIVESHHQVLKPYILTLNKLKKREWTCVFCKIAMLKRAEEIAREKGALGVVMGDSLGQVASQTLENLYIISQSIKMPIYRPLIGFDKNEIIAVAKEIDTYENFLEYPHCECPFKPEHVITQGNYEEFKKISSHLNAI